MQNKEKIRKYLAEHRQASGAELADYLEISDRAVRKQLANMLERGEVKKRGIPPTVYYYLIDREDTLEKNEVKGNLARIVEECYMILTPSGERLDGIEGFTYWCKKMQLPLEKTMEEYVAILNKFAGWKRGGLIDGTQKLITTYGKSALAKLFYLDFYSIDRFGKTKLGQLLLLAKQSQDKKLIAELIKEIKPRIKALIVKYSINYVGFVPPTVKRRVQLMIELSKKLKLGLKTIEIKKIRSRFLVPQKTLSKLADRIENARNTMVVKGEAVKGNILLIDDAVGSGATLNETAKQMRERGLVTGKIIGLAIVGSYKGFDVISEV